MAQQELVNQAILAAASAAAEKPRASCLCCHHSLKVLMIAVLTFSVFVLPTDSPRKARYPCDVNRPGRPDEREVNK